MWEGLVQYLWRLGLAFLFFWWVWQLVAPAIPFLLGGILIVLVLAGLLQRR